MNKTQINILILGIAANILVHASDIPPPAIDAAQLNSGVANHAIDVRPCGQVTLAVNARLGSFTSPASAASIQAFRRGDQTIASLRHPGSSVAWFIRDEVGQHPWLAISRTEQAAGHGEHHIVRAKLGVSLSNAPQLLVRASLRDRDGHVYEVCEYANRVSTSAAAANEVAQ